MFRLQYDTNSPFNLRFPHPQERDDIVKLGQDFVAYERSRPPELRTPYLPLVAEVLQQVQANRATLHTGQVNRAIASDSIKQLDRRLARYSRQIWLAVGVFCKDAEAKAVNWGLPYNASTGNIILPQGRPKRLALLKRYIIFELSRDEAMRFRMPVLAEGMRLRDELEAYQRQYETGQQSVLMTLIDDRLLVELMLKHLQSAVVHLLTFQFDYKLTKELQNWGFDMVERR
ncbi:MAG: hypothetical protein H6631_10155 [Anaerolineaceae bacterium]|nr:hypothetical protein [Anaerolineaceae bacterium]